MTAEQLATLVGDHLDTMRGDLERLLIERLDQRVAEMRGDLLEKLLQLRAPDYQLTPKGELYCDGKRIGDVRPVFRDVVAEVLAETRPKSEQP